MVYLGSSEEVKMEGVGNPPYTSEKGSCTPLFSADIVVSDGDLSIQDVYMRFEIWLVITDHHLIENFLLTSPIINGKYLQCM